MATKWKVEVDWNRDGTYSEVTDYVTELQWFLGFRVPYMGTASEAYLHLTLNNADRRFSPENSSGPLYGNLTPLRPLRVTSDDGSTVRTHWSGWINMIEPATNKYGARQAVFEFIEIWYNQQRRHSGLGFLSPAQYELAAD